MKKVWLVEDPNGVIICAFDDDAGEEAAEGFIEELKEHGPTANYSRYEIDNFAVGGPLRVYGDDVVQAVADFIELQREDE